MDGGHKTLEQYTFQETGGLNVFSKAFTSSPEVARQMLDEAMEHPWQTAADGAKTVLVSGAFGLGIGYLVPARGPASMILAAGLTIPQIWSAGKTLVEAYQESQEIGASQDLIAHQLARHAIKGGVDLTLGFAGGFLGAEGGYRLAESESTAGRLGQKTQKGIVDVENKGLAFLRKSPAKLEIGLPGRTMPLPELPGLKLPKIDIRTGASRLSAADQMLHGSPVEAESIVPAAKPKPTVDVNAMPFYKRPIGLVNRRLDQLLQEPEPYTLYKGPGLHGHSNRSDGSNEPSYIYRKGREAGYDYTTITDHEHPDGVSPKDGTDGPNIGTDPRLYMQTFADARAATEDGKFVALNGLEIGRIGNGGGHSDLIGPEAVEAQSALPAQSRTEGGQGSNDGILPTGSGEPVSAALAHPGASNHIGLLEVETFFTTSKAPRSLFSQLTRRMLGLDPGPVVRTPDIVKFEDGNYKALVDHLDPLTDTTGGRPSIQLNHPNRNRLDHDYGQKSFKSQKEWRTRFGKYVDQIEVIKGGALRKEPIDEVPEHMIDHPSYNAYIDKGIHASPTFGRDFHYEPTGNPGATGIYAKGLTKPDLLDALRNRRTIATTNGDKLNGFMWGNDKHFMGSILDQAAAKELRLSVHVGGDVVPDAEYTVKIWGDKKIGDGNPAEVIYQQKLTGQELIDAGYKVEFDPIDHTLGRKSSYHAEIDRKDPQTGHTDKMWTAPIWVEPPASPKHSLYMRLISGNLQHYVPNPY